MYSLLSKVLDKGLTSCNSSNLYYDLIQVWTLEGTKPCAHLLNPGERLKKKCTPQSVTMNFTLQHLKKSLCVLGHKTSFYGHGSEPLKALCGEKKKVWMHMLTSYLILVSMEGLVITAKDTWNADLCKAMLTASILWGVSRCQV